jgi:c-di-GMP-binding flagellar brake protein YcgR
MDGKPSSEEKRRHKRISVNFIVVYRVNSPVTIKMLIGDKETHAIAVDLSEEGLAVLTNYELNESVYVTVRFIMLDDTSLSVADRTRTLEIDGEVRYCFLTKEKAYRIGIHFLDISDYDRRFIANFVKKQPS